MSSTNPATGKRIQKHSKWYDLKKDAKEAEQEYLKSINRNLFSSSITIRDIWNSYTNFKKDNLKITSYKALTNKKQHFETIFNVKAVKFNYNSFQKWKDTINHKDFSTRHKNNIYKCLRSLLKYGEKYMNLNFERLLIQMTGFSNPNELKKEMKFFTYDEFLKFIKVENDLTYKTLFKTLYFCGLRIGEALALTWNDIEFSDDYATIKISKTVTQKIRGEKYIILPPKTKSSNRILPVRNNALIGDLKALNGECSKIYGFSSDWFIFGNLYPLAETTIQKRKNNNCEKANVECIRIHDFRHSCASLLINKGASIALVSKYLGHTDITTTLNIYSHMFKSELDDVAIELANL